MSELRPVLSSVPMSDPRVTILLTDLAREYVARYGSSAELGSTEAADFDPPHGTFLVLTDTADRTLAGGGVRRFDGTTCEIKRMWASPDHRRQGRATSILRSLEASAIDLGYSTIRLETGPSPPEAAALYARSGYRRIAVYGPYPAVPSPSRRTWPPSQRGRFRLEHRDRREARRARISGALRGAHSTSHAADRRLERLVECRADGRPGAQR